MLKNRIRGIFRKKGIQPDYRDIFTLKARQWLKSLRDSQINTYLKIIDSLDKEMKPLTNYITTNKNLARLINTADTMYGIGKVAKLVIASEIGDIKRFQTPRKLCSYAGLVPSQMQSGNKDYRGGITKQGSKWLRWILIQCANVAIKKPGKFQTYYYRLRNDEKSPNLIYILEYIFSAATHFYSRQPFLRKGRCTLARCYRTHLTAIAYVGFNRSGSL
jgi:transposase